MSNHTIRASRTDEPGNWREVYPDTRNLASRSDAGDAAQGVRITGDTARDPERA